MMMVKEKRCHAICVVSWIYDLFSPDVFPAG
jgi:hypothetical protein